MFTEWYIQGHIRTNEETLEKYLRVVPAGLVYDEDQSPSVRYISTKGPSVQLDASKTMCCALHSITYTDICTFIFLIHTYGMYITEN